MLLRVGYGTMPQPEVQFVYGGCEGNGNNFANETECMDVCGYKPPTTSTSTTTSTSPSPSQSPYAFDSNTGSCTDLAYGGCGGNDNNFKTLEECRSACEN
ncbi:unnamed protein product [Diatraea saccharalis]|uniref:BPTI/Kunitz inhibitor domain-containing protein n=1 Tax=Diatraea saccharalis TaxID=40085 RepID=A0A9N9RBQ5_9NEOP|nr:unnamed protein product [Diatraea saccharalis]